MTETNRTPIRWTRERAAFLAVGCLMAGFAGGWSIHGARIQSASTTSVPAPAASAPGAPDGPAPEAPDPGQLKQMADIQAAPLLAQLKSEPANPSLLASVGNLYYDAQQYPTAVDYYARALKIRPADAAVRTDMGTAFWFMGDSDRAIAEFNRALTYAPDNPNTLFNLGLVKWKGKKDGAAAVTAWKKLLARDPAYQQRDQVEKMLAEVRESAAGNPVAQPR
jgi:cytochrome c-type biogenesis protein CcmH/NrfG